MKNLLFILLVSAVMASAFPEEFQRDDSSQKFTLDEIVVTASKSESPLMNVSANVDVINEKEIKDIQASNIADLVGKYIPGHFHKYNGGESVIGIRGFRTDGDDINSHVLVLIDGHRLGTGNLSKIPLGMVEKIEVLNGPASALYGSQAMGGVVNIITKKSGKDSVEVGLNSGSFDYANGSLSLSKELSEKINVFISGEYEDINDYKIPDFGTVYNSSENKKNLGMNITWKPSDISSLRIGGSIVEYYTEVPEWKNWVLYSEYDSNNKEFSQKDHSYMDLEYNNSEIFGDNITNKTIIFFNNDLNEFNYGLIEAESDLDSYKNHTIGIDQQFGIKSFENHKLVTGFNIEKYERNGKAKRNYVNVRPYIPDMEQESDALYFQDEMNLRENIGLNFGLRYDFVKESTKTPANSEYMSFVEKEEEFDHLSPKIGIVYKSSNDKWHLKGNISSGFKAPAPDQLASEYEYEDWGINYRILGNPDLEPEKSLTYDLGYDYGGEYVDFSLIFFSTKWEDKIEESSTLVSYRDLDWKTWSNIGEATIEGIELGFNYRIQELIGMKNNMEIFSKAVFNTKYEDDITGDDLNYISDYEYKNGLRFDIIENLNVSINNVIVGPQKIQNWDNWTAVIEEKKSFDFTDLSMTYKLNENVSFSGSINNLFDQDYEWVRGYIMPERNYKIGTQIKF